MPSTDGVGERLLALRRQLKTHPLQLQLQVHLQLRLQVQVQMRWYSVRVAARVPAVRT